MALVMVVRSEDARRLGQDDCIEASGIVADARVQLRAAVLGWALNDTLALIGRLNRTRASESVDWPTWLFLAPD